MMKPATAIILLIAALVLLLASHLHDSAHRYDVVVAAAGSGGSQDTTGSTETEGYLVDHKTGRVWELTGQFERPGVLAPCLNDPSIKQTDHGCEIVTPQSKTP